MAWQDKAWAGNKFLGKPQDGKAGRDLKIKQKDFSAADQAVPIPVAYGTFQLAGIYITPVFGFRSEEIATEAGK